MPLDTTAAHAAIDALASEHDRLVGVVIAAMQSTISAQEAEIDRLRARVAELEALLEQPIPAGTLFGVNASNVGQAAEHARLFAPVKVWRYFHQPGEGMPYPATAPKASDRVLLGPGQHYCCSWKVHPAQVTKAMALAAFRQAPTDRTFYVCPWHEPSGELDARQFTKAQYDQAFRVFREAADEVGPHIKVVAIMEGWNWHSNRKPEDYLPPADTYDVLGADVYFDGPIGPTVGRIPTEFDPIIATAKKLGKTWAAPELGIGTKVKGQARLDAIRKLAETVREKGAEFACYFDNADWTLTGDAIAAWKAGITR